MRIARLNNFNRGYQSPFDEVLKSTDNIIVEKVAERIEYYITYGEILLNINNMGNYPLYKEVAKKLTENSYGISSMKILEVLQNYEMIKTGLGIIPAILIKRLDSWVKYAKTNITVDNINSISLEFFADAINTNNEIAEHCIETAKSYLKSKSKEDWKQSIIENNFDYQLVVILKLDFQDCFDAFKELLVENIQTNDFLSNDKCNSLITLFESNGRDMLNTFNDVRDRFCDGAYSMNNDLFDLYGEWLLKYAKLEDKKTALRTIFTSSILDKKENINLLLSYQEKMIKIVEKAEEENKDFKDKIKSLLGGEYKDDVEFNDFAKKLGINKSNNTEDDLKTE